MTNSVGDASGHLTEVHMYQVCPLCGDADDVELLPLDGGVVKYTCTRARRHLEEAPYVWLGWRDTADVLGQSEDGPAHDLGMLDDLVACVRPDEPWIECGIVERRHRDLSPQAFGILVEHWGRPHTG